MRGKGARATRGGKSATTSKGAIIQQSIVSLIQSQGWWPLSHKLLLLGDHHLLLTRAQLHLWTRPISSSAKFHRSLTTSILLQWAGTSLWIEHLPTPKKGASLQSQNLKTQRAKFLMLKKCTWRWILRKL